MDNIMSYKESLLLASKGFNKKCKEYYISEVLIHSVAEWSNDEFLYNSSCVAPNIYQVAEWLREEKKIHISVEVTQIYYYFTISFIPNCNKVSSDKKFFTFEEALKEAINFVINTLI